MSYYESMHELIGHTPMVKLCKIGSIYKANLFAKLEIMNPAGSVKDRTCKYMMEQAIADGLLKPGGTIVEATSGNTGLGIAFVALGKGYRVIFVVPDKVSIEKQKLMRALGAEVVNTPKEEGMLGATAKAEQLRTEISGAISLEQFKNPANPKAHYETTGPEIYEDMNGQIDYMVMGAGTGGTYTGVMKYLKERNPNIKGILADPIGSIMGGGHDHHTYRIEGIGNDFIPETMDTSLVDEVYKITDDEAFEAARQLAREEGILVGSSSGATLAAVKKFADKLDGGNIVMLFPDRGERYFSTGIYG